MTNTPPRTIDYQHQVVAIVLGGGRGTRLYPLTRFRSKPAVPLAGKYRLIDVPISNCINSGMRKIYVLTQFLSASLNRHIALTYQFDRFSSGFVAVLAAEQTLETELWYQGTADAVRKNLHHILDADADYILILSGDALYRENFQEVLAEHIENNADITVCCKLVDEQGASGFGIVGIDEQRRITSFHEKPRGEKLTPLKASAETLRRAGMRETSKPYLASMGIYVFNTSVLRASLGDPTAEDFGKQVIPRAIARRKVFAHLFEGYWEDIGTIKSFFEANLELNRDHPPFDFYTPEFPIFTHSRQLPSSHVVDSRIDRTLVAEGCRIERATIANSIIGIRSLIAQNTKLENVVMMGADYYERADHDGNSPHMGIGSGTSITNAIIDKNARIGHNVTIRCHAGQKDEDNEMFSVRDGIVIVPKNAVVPDSTEI